MSYYYDKKQIDILKFDKHFIIIFNVNLIYWKFFYFF